MSWTLWFGTCCTAEKAQQPEPLRAETGSELRKKHASATECASSDGASKAPPPSTEEKIEAATGDEAAAAPVSKGGSQTMTVAKTAKDAPQVSKVSAYDHDVQVNEDTETMSVCSSVKSTARSANSISSVTSEYIKGRIPARQREAERIQKEMKKFVRTMVRGTPMGVLSPDGQMRTCTCSLDKKMKNFVLELKGVTRKIALSSIMEVYQGKEPEDIETPLDEFCSTLTLDQGEAITFHFKDIPSRESFAQCLQLLVDGQH